MADPTSTAAPAAAPSANTAPARRGLLSRDKIRLGLGLTAIVLVSGLIGWWFTQPVKLSQSDQVAQALKLLDQGKFSAAREIAKKLEAQNYKHPGFAGVLEFIQGMATFGLIEAAGEASEKAQYLTVITYLRDAARLSLSNERRPEWCYALGKSLYLVEDSLAARPLLEEARETYPARRIDQSQMLIDLYLDPGVRTPELLDKAMRMNDDILAEMKESDHHDPRNRDVAYLQRSEIYLATQRFEEAANVLKQLTKATAKSHVTQILQARILLAQERFTEALERLEPIAMKDRLGQANAQEACYLMGLAAEELWERGKDSDDSEGQASQRTDHLDDAIIYFRRTAERYDRTAEATAANLHLGRLWRFKGGDDKAMEYYGAALASLKSLRSVDSFRNRWLSQQQFRQAILDAWNGWLADQRFSYAIALSELMTPLFPREEAYEFAARVHQRWAESIEEELSHKSFTIRKERTEELRRRWRHSAQAFARLAEARLSSAKYPEALWNAAEQYHRGHDFEPALEMINQFIATEPDRMMAAALVKRSRIELDLDRIPDALIDLQTVVRTYPTDPATFSALYLIGVCYLEQNQLERAKTAWQSILNSDQLSPSAVEWRDAQLSLGRLQFELGELKRRELLRRSVPAAPAALVQIYKEASAHWQEASRLLGRHLERNQSGEGLAEARYYLAKSLQRESEWLSKQLEIAETDNARQQLESQHDIMLRKAVKQFEQLRDDLGGPNNDQIDDLQQRLLKNCIFEIPHSYFELREYDKAIGHYNAAINRYPQDVQTLVAYIQMGQCHKRMNRTVEARNMLQQARLLLSHNQIPDAEFEVPSTNLSRLEWEEWLDRARQVQ